MSPIDELWLLICAILVLFMQAGFVCLESGLTRHKNSINVAIKNFADFGISALVFWAVGFGLMFGMTDHGLIGTTDFFFRDSSGSRNTSIFLYEIMFAAAAVTIVSGAVAERMRFASYLVVSFTISLFIYPVVGHWIWNGVLTNEAGGWLARLGFLDFAGSSVVHSTGGWVALAAVLIIGPRMGRFPKNGPPREIQGSNIPYAILGILILWVGWLGFNGGSTFAFNSTVPKVLINTMIAPVAGIWTGLIWSWWRHGHASINLVMNGALGGLVAVTASSNMVTTLDSIIIGIVAALVVSYTTDLLERFKIDDVVGAIPVHCAAGVWGTLAVAIFGDTQYFHGMGRFAQFFVQLLGVGVVFVWAFGVTYILLRIINLYFPLRIAEEQEAIGLNVSEHKVTTEILDLYRTMEEQAMTGDMKARLHEEPFTEAGQIARRYNLVLDRITLENEVSKRMAELANIAKEEAELATTKLSEKVEELDRFQQMAVGRELRMIKLKQTINDLLIQMGQPPRYDLNYLGEKELNMENGKAGDEDNGKQ